MSQFILELIKMDVVRIKLYGIAEPFESIYVYVRSPWIAI
jgi:hypothetical protein